MQDVANDTRVLSLVSRSGIRNSLVTLLDQLQRCQKSLNEFLEVCLLTSPHAFHFVYVHHVLNYNLYLVPSTTYLPTYLPSTTYLSTFLPTYLPLPIYLPLPTCLPTYLPTYLSRFLHLPGPVLQLNLR